MTFTKQQQAANRRKWIAALRSGDYQQTQGTLRAKLNDGTDGFCCLGVACDLAAVDRIGYWGDDGDFVVPDEEPRSDTLPKLITEWLGLSDGAGMYYRDNSTMSLIMHNDDLHWETRSVNQ